MLALLSKVDELHREALPWLLQETDEPDDFLQGFVSEPDHVALLAIAPAESLAGILLAFIRESTRNPILRPARIAEIETLVVAPPFRRNGVGSTLVRAAFQWADDSRATRTELGVYDFNDAAVRFWLANGFQPLSRRLVLHAKQAR